MQANAAACAEGPVFCCNGCRFVYGIIHANDLEQFYELGSGVRPPVQPGVFQRKNFDWIAELSSGSGGRFRVQVQGISCLGCVWLVERVFQKFDGALHGRLDPVRAQLALRVIPGVFPAIEFAEAVQRLGYLLGPVSEDGRKDERTDGGLTLRMGVCAALAMNAMLFATPAYCGLAPEDRWTALFEKGALVCATLSMAVGASYFLRRAFTALRMRMVHIDQPIALGLVAAYAGSLAAWWGGDRRALYFDFVSVFTFLMLVGRWVHQTALQGNRLRILDAPSAGLRPTKGERYTVAAGQVVPVRSVLHSPEASLGLEWINGEPEARTVRSGNLVPSGAINLAAGDLSLEALEDWKDSLLAELLEAQPSRDTADAGTQRFISFYVAAVLAIGITGAGGWLLTGHPLVDAMQVLLSVLVVSCPCASGVALPFAGDLAVARMCEASVFVREHAVWARLLRVGRIAFDKTGTLTTETIQLLDRTALDALCAEQTEALGQLVSRSMHPVPTALREALGTSAGGRAPLGGPCVESVGNGTEWTAPDGALWRLGRPGWALGDGHSNPNAAQAVLSRNGLSVAGFEFGEALRTDAKREVEWMHKEGLQVVVLSGDRKDRVQRVSDSLGIPAQCAHGGMTPHAKADWLRAHGALADTLMLGDGANDSLAFAESLCCGTPAVDRGVLGQKADFYYLGRGLGGIRLLIQMARCKRRATVAVLLFTGVYNAVAVALALAGKMHPLWAAVLMPLSSLATLGLVFLFLRRRKNASGGRSGFASTPPAEIPNCLYRSRQASALRAVPAPPSTAAPFAKSLSLRSLMPPLPPELETPPG
jgi:Cu2+-exporting ATPase